MSNLSSKKKVAQPKVKPYTAWLASNFGIPVSVERTRRGAIEYAQNITGEPWSRCKKYFAVCKVKVTPL